MNAHVDAAPAAAGWIETFRKLVSRLADVLERENADLRNGDLSAVPDYVRQKDLLLLDLSRLTGGRDGLPDISGIPHDELHGLRRMLAENARLLELQLGAAREFASFLEDSIRRHRSDGTYTPGSVRGYGKW